jgi:hypothetical protein
VPVNALAAKEMLRHEVSLKSNVLVVASMSKEWEIYALQAPHGEVSEDRAESGILQMVEGRMDKEPFAIHVGPLVTRHESAVGVVNAMLAAQGPVQLANVSVARPMPNGRPVVLELG